MLSYWMAIFNVVSPIAYSMVVAELLAHFPSEAYSDLWDDRFRRFATLDDVKAYFGRRGSARVKSFAQRVASSGAVHGR